MRTSRRGRSVALLAAALALVSGSTGAAVSVPIEIHNDHVFVQVSLPHAPPLWFLVDSGAAAPVNLIDRRAADRAGLSGSGQQTAGAIGGSVHLTFSRPLSLAVGTASLPRATLGIMALADGAAQEGHRVDGLLGFAFFSAFNPQIDYPARRMILSATPPMIQGAVPLAIVNKNCRIAARLVLAAGEAPLTVRLIIDTGFDGALVLNSPFVRRHGLLKGKNLSVAGASLGGSTTGALSRIAALSIGATRETNVPTRLSSDTQGPFAAGDADGYIGGALLANYSVLFDYAHGRLTLLRRAARTIR